MEIVIVICLLIVIALLVQDKIIDKKMSEQKPIQEKANRNLPDIMGKPKPLRSLPVPNANNENQTTEQEINPDDLDIEHDENENVSIQIPQDEPDELLCNIPDLVEEEEEWRSYGIAAGDNGFAQGVTFEELSSVGVLLQENSLKPSQKETAGAIVQKLQGTELFSLLENSIEGASRKIAELLDSTLLSDSDEGSFKSGKSDLEGFDIGEFA